MPEHLFHREAILLNSVSHAKSALKGPRGETAGF